MIEIKVDTLKDLPFVNSVNSLVYPFRKIERKRQNERGRERERENEKERGINMRKDYVAKKIISLRASKK